MMGKQAAHSVLSSASHEGGTLCVSWHNCCAVQSYTQIDGGLAYQTGYFQISEKTTVSHPAASEHAVRTEPNANVYFNVVDDLEIRKEMRLRYVSGFIRMLMIINQMQAGQTARLIHANENMAVRDRGTACCVVLQSQVTSSLFF